MSERSNVSRFATWVGGQLKGVRTYVDQQLASTTTSLTQQIAQAKVDVKADIVGTAGAALDTLGEVADRLAADEGAVAGILTGMGLRVRVDEAQTFTAPQQAQGRANIGAASAADLGTTEVDYVAVAEQAMTS